MIYRCEYYFLDCGRQFAFCPLKITAPLALIPTILANLLGSASLGYCDLPIVPRRVILTMTDGEIFYIEYPFSPAMSQWIDFWNELNQYSAIASLTGTGESISDNHLRNYLFL